MDGRIELSCAAGTTAFTLALPVDSDERSRG